MKKKILLIICLLMAFALVGCGLSVKSPTEAVQKEPYMLNERQKEILQKSGLSTDYSQLNMTQKSAIEAIEDMLEYLEKKYPEDTFTYNGYVSGANMEREHLLANCSYGEVTVYRNYTDGAFEYEDDYKELKAAQLYMEILNDCISKSMDDNDFIVHASVGECRSTDYTRDNLLSLCNAGVSVYVREKVGEEKFSDLCKKIESFFDEKAVGGSVTAGFYLVKESEFYPDLPSGFDSSIKSDVVLNEIHYLRFADGKTNVY